MGGQHFAHSACVLGQITGLLRREPCPSRPAAQHANRADAAVRRLGGRVSHPYQPPPPREARPYRPPPGARARAPRLAPPPPPRAAPPPPPSAHLRPLPPP